jgi:hypothetical protein
MIQEQSWAHFILKEVEMFFIIQSTIPGGLRDLQQEGRRVVQKQEGREGRGITFIIIVVVAVSRYLLCLHEACSFSDLLASLGEQFLCEEMFGLVLGRVGWYSMRRQWAPAPTVGGMLHHYLSSRHRSFVPSTIIIDWIAFGNTPISLPSKALKGDL